MIFVEINEMPYLYFSRLATWNILTGREFSLQELLSVLDHANLCNWLASSSYDKPCLIIENT